MAKPKTSTSIRRAIAAASILLSGAATAATMATQPWVTNKIAQAISSLPPADLTAATNYTDAVANAITNAPPENWQEQTAPVSYATAPVSVTLTDGGTLAFTGDWPDAKPVYLRVITGGAYSVAPAVRLLGYTKWPDAGSTFQCAVWFTGTQYLLNLILVE